MDATVQVAAFGIIATLISTAGVVLVAIINKSSNPTKALSTHPPVNEEDVPDSEWARIMYRKETAIRNRDQTIIQQKAYIKDVEEENAELRAHREHCLRNHNDEQSS